LEDLMALVPLVEKSQVGGVAREALDRGEELYGRVLNTWMAIANRPPILAAYLPFLRSVAGPGALDPRVKELTAVKVALDNHCLYTTSHRCSSAAKQGISEDELAALARDEWSPFSSTERLALRLAHELTVHPTAARYDAAPQVVSAELLAELQDAFAPDELTELVMNIAVWNALARFHRVMGFELDMPEPPPAVRDAL
jgi:AhpD family alkylhydroperoxidase